MAWPLLSIRSTVLASIVVGVLLPALLLLAVDGQLAREAQQPIVERNRTAVVVLSSAMLAEPAWTLSAPALRTALRQILDQPTVCGIELLDLLPTATPLPLHRDECQDVRLVAQREAPVVHEGRIVARMRLSFDDTEIDRLVADRRNKTAWLVAAQVLFGVAVLAGVLSLRLLRPIDALKRQAGRLALREPQSTQTWARDDELGELGKHLNSVHEQLLCLFDELERKNRQLERMAMYDDLTGLPNRTLIRELFLHESATMRRNEEPLAMVFIDLDHFKSVNDQHGHAAGDELLVTVGQRLREQLRESDLIGRLGGDEFVAMLPRVEGREHAIATAQRLIQALRRPVRLAGVTSPVQIGASIGIAMHPDDGSSFDALVHAADVAMYRSKDLGRGRFSLYDVEMDTTLRARIDLEREVAEAVEKDQLRLFIQPLYDARDGSLIGGEALVRWMHPRRGLLEPAAFIAAAESTGVIRPLGLWVVENACRQLAEAQAHGRPGLRIAVNVSALQLQDESFAEAIASAMQRHALAAGALTLELTESTLLADSEGVMRALTALRGTGVQLAIDDFGTGYSSLRALKLVRPELLKIDRSFISDLPQGENDCALAEAIFGMAQALNIAVVAEGVETAEQRDWLVERGCWRQQGYLWSRPLAAEAFLALLAT